MKKLSNNQNGMKPQPMEFGDDQNSALMVNLDDEDQADENHSFLHGIDHISNGVTQLQVEQSNFAAVDIEKIYQQHQKMAQERNKQKTKQELIQFLEKQQQSTKQQQPTVSTKFMTKDDEDLSDESTLSDDDLNDSNLTIFYMNNPMSIDGILMKATVLSMP